MTLRQSKVRFPLGFVISYIQIVLSADGEPADGIRFSCLERSGTDAALTSPDCRDVVEMNG